jgi:hypothetical protein
MQRLALMAAMGLFADDDTILGGALNGALKGAIIGAIVGPLAWGLLQIVKRMQKKNDDRPPTADK